MCVCEKDLQDEEEDEINETVREIRFFFFQYRPEN